ncbi:type I-Fv CRISPR-associated protein Cas5fv [Acinetobacter sp. VNH17]|uniref:Type I-Fv CRISPR-associated protein Cas5fv n=1 Tax=Acinetobacter thutiue TaxID=2998078 RepID=A0ABT7WPZ3_9GAMM|nr:type I-Fv CRISPR-associated protein Cas5fv [Acinetobacter thutiue]MCY6412651.1 type I-Fv CRISPR-associated protein Cas5fv [Acinetobacter thutiue]MDN0014758.1 type I-Fv CRISPR-associated protein Cas5fv [Acinetobacter thutiue]
MQIIIEYDSSWRNSFLDGSNNEPLPKGGRNFIASMTTLKQAGNYKKRDVTKDTVMGILNRLIGEQRKLYQARQDKEYYFSEIEKILQDEDIIDKSMISNEMVYIRNVSGSTDQNSFTGMIKANDPAFKSEYSSELWGILWLDLDTVVQFILDEKYQIKIDIELDPITVCSQIELLNAEKAIDIIDSIKDALDILQSKFDDVNYLNAKEQLPLMSLYASALYLQIERLSKKYDLTNALTKSGGLSGISKRGFTKKDFMDRYTTGSKKLIWGNPFLLKEKKKGEGEVISILSKASGELTINLNISKDQARDLEEKIENAGVSSFYLGKKGLAYVTDIRI